MVRKIGIICLMMTCSFLFTACRSSELQCTVLNVPDTEYVTFTVNDISLTGISIHFDNNTDKCIIYGRRYIIEQRQGEKWTALDTLDNNGIAYTFTAEAYSFTKAGMLTLDWSRLYGSLTKGSYRLILDDFNFESDVQGQWPIAVSSPTFEFDVE